MTDHLASVGLTGDEAARRLAEHGPNRLPESPRRTWPERVGAQLRDPMILLLIGAFVVVVVLGDVPDSVIIAVVVVVNTAIGVTQELRAEQAIAALRQMAAPRATVFRDGQVQEVDATVLVPGDLVRLEAGDVVPADAALDESVTLQVDESAMTGESVPVGRAAGEEVLAGTVVTRGRGVATVLRTGADSGLGAIAAVVAETRSGPTPLQRRLARLSRTLVVVVVLLAVLVFVLGLLRGEPVTTMLILAVSLAVAAIPESLPAVVSVALALGAYRMARRSAVVRWLPAVETLGSVTVLASDKTGTLTEGRMVVRRLWTPAGTSEVTGHGYASSGDIVGGAREEVVDLLRDAALCNDAHLTGPTSGEWGVVGDPMEGALLIAAGKAGLDVEQLRAAWPRVDEVPFDAERRRMTTVHTGDGEWLTVCKGAPEAILDLLDATSDVAAARAAAVQLAEQGFRVLALAHRTDRSRPSPEALDSGLHLVGLTGIADPPRPGAEELVTACRSAGVRTVLITGDHPATAKAVGAELGITVTAPEVADGAMVARGEHTDRVEQIGIYARTQPEQKVDILGAWQRRGHIVAMTGDGVNDAPALRSADIGVAMGNRGTEVARQAADLVLADDDLSTVVVAVAEGRRIFTNIRTFLRYALSGGLAEVAVLVAGPFLGMPLPLLPAQILWINMLTHGVPGVAFGGEPLDRAVMSRPSMSPERSVLGAGLGRQILVSGTLITVVSLVAGMIGDAQEASVQTRVFLTLGLAQLWLALALRAPRTGVGWRDRGLEVAVLVAGALQLAGVSVPLLRDLLGTTTVSSHVIVLLMVLSAVPAATVVVGRRLSRVTRSGPS